MTTWILRLLLIVLPVAVALYWIWLRRSHAKDAPKIRTREIQLSVLSGLLVVGLFVALYFIPSKDGGEEGDFYVAPYEVNGKIVPGEFISQEEAKARGLLVEKVVREDDTLETFGD